jgi:drug/metabolite transporter (DMT)-like permease
VNIFFYFYYFFVCFGLAFVNVHIQRGNIPTWFTLFGSLLMMCGGYFMLQLSTLSLTQQSVLITISTSVGYQLGLKFMGDNISNLQWFGIFLSVIAAILVNHK